MSFELDHVFIFVEHGAPEAQALIDMGLIEGPANVHPGQGTANRRFFFSNMMLELLWVSNEEEVKRPVTQPTMFWQRWNGRGMTTSPFGIIVQNSAEKIPFDHWHYSPDYLPEGTSFAVADNADKLVEPMIFIMPSVLKKTGAHPLPKQPRFHSVTSIALQVPPPGSDSPILSQLHVAPNIRCIPGEQHLMEIVFDQGGQGEVKDFRPALPLIFRW